MKFSPPGLWDIHLIQHVAIHILIIKPRTIARLPLFATEHAELRRAPTLHMVAAFLQLHHGGTVEASLPAFLFGDLDEALRSFVPRTVPRAVPFAIALDADFRLAPRTFAVAPAVRRPASEVLVDVVRPDPFAAAPCGTVQPVLRHVLLVLLVPAGLELGVEQPVDVLQGDMVRRAALGRHVLRVRDGHGEDAFQTGVAHPVRAG